MSSRKPFKIIETKPYLRIFGIGWFVWLIPIGMVSAFIVAISPLWVDYGGYNHVKVCGNWSVEVKSCHQDYVGLPSGNAIVLTDCRCYAKDYFEQNTDEVFAYENR